MNPYHNHGSPFPPAGDQHRQSGSPMPARMPMGMDPRNFGMPMGTPAQYAGYAMQNLSSRDLPGGHILPNTAAGPSTGSYFVPDPSAVAGPSTGPYFSPGPSSAAAVGGAVALSSPMLSGAGSSEAEEDAGPSTRKGKGKAKSTGSSSKGKGRERAQAAAAQGTPAKSAVMMRARRKERKTPARPFTATQPLIPLLDTMTAAELASARAHNTRVAAERKDNERRRNNQSAKRARIRKMATAVSLGDEILRLRGEVARARAEADMWRDLAYERDVRALAASLPARDGSWAANPLGTPPHGQHPLEGHYADEVADMRRCLKEYVRSEDLVAICTREFHDEIAAVLQRGEEIRAALPPHVRKSLSEDDEDDQREGAAAANDGEDTDME